MRSKFQNVAMKRYQEVGILSPLVTYSLARVIIYSIFISCANVVRFLSRQIYLFCANCLSKRRFFRSSGRNVYATEILLRSMLVLKEFQLRKHGRKCVLSILSCVYDARNLVYHDRTNMGKWLNFPWFFSSQKVSLDFLLDIT